ncbi:MAG: (Fe-S)-binding protein [Candidatus Lokiarchaeota archaeon]|nr:(Fe-S)-binding protein [Candidatus Lokiarchaeota archaeon]
MRDYLKYPTDRKKYPTEEIDPNNFYPDDEVKEMVRDLDLLRFSQEDFKKLYNCVHCGLCETEMERIKLKQEFLKQGFTIQGLEEMRRCFHDFRTPYPTNQMRIKRPPGIPKESETLYFMGCLSTIRIPKYTEHSLKYLLKQGIEFTILDKEICCGWPWFASGSMEEFETCKKENIEIFSKYKKIICLCPACYFLFNNYYEPEMSSDTEFMFVADYLKPSSELKSGKVEVQHLCQLINRGREDVSESVDEVLKKSGYEVENVPHWCCGGGLGYMHRTDVIDGVAKKRMRDFDRQDVNYATTYCVSCWWILRRFSKQCKIHPKAMDIFELLM